MHNVSLVLFTSFAQAAVGMVVLLALAPCKEATLSAPAGFLRERLHRQGGVALVAALGCLALAVPFSLLHLSDKLIAFYSIANVGSSWLSREILFVGLFGGATLALFLVRNRALALVASLLGLGLVYVMSQVYITPPVPFWQTSLTFWVFLSTCFLLGSATLLLVLKLQKREASLLPVIVAAAAGLRLLLGFAQVTQGSSFTAPSYFFYLHAGGIVLALTLLALAAKRAMAGASQLSLVALATVLFWAAEISARIMFYEAVSSFTM